MPNGAIADTPWGALPGADLVSQGLHDLGTDVESVEALLVLIAEPELRLLGIDVPNGHHRVRERKRSHLRALNTPVKRWDFIWKKP